MTKILTTILAATLLWGAPVVAADREYGDFPFTDGFEYCFLAEEAGLSHCETDATVRCTQRGGRCISSVCTDSVNAASCTTDADCHHPELNCSEEVPSGQACLERRSGSTAWDVPIYSHMASGTITAQTSSPDGTPFAGFTYQGDGFDIFTTGVCDISPGNNRTYKCFVDADCAANSDCTASETPAKCCTGSGTGTCLGPGYSVGACDAGTDIPYSRGYPGSSCAMAFVADASQTECSTSSTCDGTAPNKSCSNDGTFCNDADDCDDFCTIDADCAVACSGTANGGDAYIARVVEERSAVVHAAIAMDSLVTNNVTTLGLRKPFMGFMDSNYENQCHLQAEFVSCDIYDVGKKECTTAQWNYNVSLYYKEDKFRCDAGSRNPDTACEPDANNHDDDNCAATTAGEALCSSGAIAVGQVDAGTFVNMAIEEDHGTCDVTPASTNCGNTEAGKCDNDVTQTCASNSDCGLCSTDNSWCANANDCPQGLLICGAWLDGVDIGHSTFLAGACTEDGWACGDNDDCQYMGTCDASVCTNTGDACSVDGDCEWDGRCSSWTLNPTCLVLAGDDKCSNNGSTTCTTDDDCDLDYPFDESAQRCRTSADCSGSDTCDVQTCDTTSVKQLEETWLGFKGQITNYASIPPSQRGTGGYFGMVADDWIGVKGPNETSAIRARVITWFPQEEFLNTGSEQNWNPNSCAGTDHWECVSDWSFESATTGGSTVDDNLGGNANNEQSAWEMGVDCINDKCSVSGLVSDIHDTANACSPTYSCSAGFCTQTGATSVACTQNEDCNGAECPLVELWSTDCDVDNNQCTAANVPAACCTGSGTGTCTGTFECNEGHCSVDRNTTCTVDANCSSLSPSGQVCVLTVCTQDADCAETIHINTPLTTTSLMSDSTEGCTGSQDPADNTGGTKGVVPYLFDADGGATAEDCSAGTLCSIGTDTIVVGTNVCSDYAADGEASFINDWNDLDWTLAKLNDGIGIGIQYQNVPGANKIIRMASNMVSVPVSLPLNACNPSLPDVNGDGRITMCVTGDSTYASSEFESQVTSKICNPDDVLFAAAGSIKAADVTKNITYIMNGSGGTDVDPLLKADALRGSVCDATAGTCSGCDYTVVGIGINSIRSSIRGITVSQGYCHNPGATDSGDGCTCPSSSAAVSTADKLGYCTQIPSGQTYKTGFAFKTACNTGECTTAQSGFAGLAYEQGIPFCFPGRSKCTAGVCEEPRAITYWGNFSETCNVTNAPNVCGGDMTTACTSDADCYRNSDCDGTASDFSCCTGLGTGTCTGGASAPGGGCGSADCDAFFDWCVPACDNSPSCGGLCFDGGTQSQSSVISSHIQMIDEADHRNLFPYCVNDTDCSNNVCTDFPDIACDVTGDCPNNSACGGTKIGGTCVANQCTGNDTELIFMAQPAGNAVYNENKDDGQQPAGDSGCWFGSFDELDSQANAIIQLAKDRGVHWIDHNGYAHENCPKHQRGRCTSDGIHYDTEGSVIAAEVLRNCMANTSGTSGTYYDCDFTQ